ncbi:MAG: MBL fold metallo-hydrolase [Promethearchaeota archaeon]
MEKINDYVYSINPYGGPLFDSSKYLIDTRSAEGLIVIDPGLYTKFLNEIEKKGFCSKDINHCLITHGHLDHFGACYQLKEINENIKFYAHESDAKRIEQKLEIKEMSESYPGYNYTPIKLTRKLKANDVLRFDEFKLKCIHTPGHTPGAVAYFLRRGESKILFGGDIAGLTLRIHGGNYNNYFDSMKRLKDLHVDILCDGHSGPIKPAKEVKDYINGNMKLNELIHLTIEKETTDIKIWNQLALHLYKLKEYSFALDFCNYILEIDPDNNDMKQLLPKIEICNPQKVNFIKPLLKKISISKKKI